MSSIIAEELTACYYEPFLGGGSVFLSVQPRRAVLSDANDKLIEFYHTCIADPEKVARHALKFTNERSTYYRVRASKPRTPSGVAGRFLYLNKTCWGGVFRLNKNGDFNVPFGDSGRVICEVESVQRASQVFSRAKLFCSDFSKSLDSAGTGDVVFADPPYTTRGQFNGFVRYNEKLFSWEDQVRLSTYGKSARRRGAFVAVCGSFHREILSLYKNWWVVEVKRKSRVARRVEFRSTVSECLIFSRKPAVNVKNLNRIDAEFIASVRSVQNE